MWEWLWVVFNTTSTHTRNCWNKRRNNKSCWKFHLDCGKKKGGHRALPLSKWKVEHLPSLSNVRPTELRVPELLTLDDWPGKAFDTSDTWTPEGRLTHTQTWMCVRKKGPRHRSEGWPPLNNKQWHDSSGTRSVLHANKHPQIRID